MDLFYDDRDAPYYRKRCLGIHRWLAELGARSLRDADANARGFLFGLARSALEYTRLVSPYPHLRDRPEERAPLLRLDTVLDTLNEARVTAPAPRTWRLALDMPLPSDLSFPLFVRTAQSSWKLGGKISKVKTPRQLEEEAAALRRALGWDALILAREWLDLAPAGPGVYGPIPQEVRTWIVDGVPVAWSFHYLNVVKAPRGFPPSAADLGRLREWAAQVGTAFRSRLVVADFARGQDGTWWFIEAGAGSCAGTEHEAVFKAVASKLRGDTLHPNSDKVGGVF